MAPNISVKYPQPYWKLKNVACVIQTAKHPTVAVTCGRQCYNRTLTQQS